MATYVVDPNDPASPSDSKKARFAAAEIRSLKSRLLQLEGAALTDGAQYPYLRKELTFAATAGQTVYAVPGGYISGHILVTKNGAKLRGSGIDYTASDGNNIQFTVALLAGAEIDVIAYGAYTPANLTAVIDSLTNIDLVASEISAVASVSDNMFEVRLLATNINGLVAIASNLTQLLAVTADSDRAELARDRAEAAEVVAVAEATSIVNTADAILLAQAETNAIMGLGLGATEVNATGELLITYDPLSITSVFIDTDGTLAITY